MSDTIKHGAEQSSDDPNRKTDLPYDERSQDTPAGATAATPPEGVMPDEWAEILRRRQLAAEALAPEAEQAPADTEPRTPSRRGFLKLLGLGGALAVGGGVTAAVVASRGGKPTPTPAPAPIQSATPTPSAIAPTTPETPPPTIEKDDSATIELMRELSIEDFNRLPGSQRRKFYAWELFQIDQGDKQPFFTQKDQFLVPADPETGFPGVSLADLNPYSSAFPEKSANTFDDGQKIVDHTLWFGQQVVEAQYASKNNIKGPVDTNLALKMLSGLSYYTDQSKHPQLTRETYDEFAHFTEQLTNAKHLGILERYLATDVSKTIQHGVDEEGRAIEYKDVEYVSHSVTKTGRFVMESIPLKVRDPLTDKVTTITVTMWPMYSSRKGRLTN